MSFPLLRMALLQQKIAEVLDGVPDPVGEQHARENGHTVVTDLETGRARCQVCGELPDA